jgi:hypothetical protein
MKFRKVCNCENQPCWVCFLLLDLYIKEINRMLDEEEEKNG